MKNWKKTKTSKWYKAICKAAKKRRGEKRSFSYKKSATMKSLWKDPVYRAKATKGRSKRMKKSWADPIVRKNHMQGAKKHSVQMKTWWKKNYVEMCEKRKAQVTDEVRKKISDIKKKMWSDPTKYKELCKIRKKQSHGAQLRHPKGSWYRTKYIGVHGTRWMRSGWEVAFALWLDFCGIRWEYETKRFCLSKGRYYHPDFYLPDQATHVELKGWLTKKDKKKIETFQRLYPDVKFYCFFQKHLAEVLQFHSKKAA